MVFNWRSSSWIEHTITGDFSNATYAYPVDIDGDGDMDILGSAYWDPITWWENIDGSGTIWVKNTIDTNFDAARSIYSEDIDGDGEMDILGAAYGDNDITWWDLGGYSPSGQLISSIFDTQDYPDWGYFEWNSDTPPGTSVSFQVRASKDHIAMGTWSDTLTSPCLLTGVLEDGARYVQYCAILETATADLTPTLNDLTIAWDPLGLEGSEPPVLQLLPFAPNPTPGFPVIRFSLAESVSVELEVFDISGRVVIEIVLDETPQGYHDVQLEDLSPGIYFCRMVSGDFAATQRFVVID